MDVESIRAWKDETYQRSLSAEQQVLLPENPAGALELSDAELEAIHGARPSPNVGGNASNGCTVGQQLGVGANAPIAGGILSNLDATDNTCLR